MKDYEVVTEETTPCGGDNHKTTNMIEVQAESPEDYVTKNGRYPILEKIEDLDGSIKIRTGDGKGYFMVYTFTEV